MRKRGIHVLRNITRNWGKKDWLFIVALVSMCILFAGFCLFGIIFFLAPEQLRGRCILFWIVAALLCITGSFLRERTVVLLLTKKIKPHKANIGRTIGFLLSLCGISIMIFGIGIEHWILCFALSWMAWGTGSLCGKFVYAKLFIDEDEHT